MGHPKFLLSLDHLQWENINLIVFLAYPGQELAPIWRYPTANRQNLEQQETVPKNTGSEETREGQNYGLEEEMATHSSILAWRIPGTEEPGGLLSVGSHRVGHDWSDLAAAEL